MLYQLPNGKIINLTIDQFLSMTDEDINDFIASNFGSYGPRYDRPCYVECVKESDTCRDFSFIEDDDEVTSHLPSIDEIIIYTDLIVEFPEVPEDPIEE